MSFTDASPVPDPAAVLVLTADPLLLEEVTRLAAAAGASPVHLADVGAALPMWKRASLVLIGGDLVAAAARVDPPRRPGVYAVSWGPPPDDLFRHALAARVEALVTLPERSEVLTDLLTDLGDPPTAEAAVVGVVGGSGGAGATTLAAALAQVGAREGPTALLDADPFGPGSDRVLGLEGAAGVRWGQLAGTTGRLGARALREALPRSDALALLTWERVGPRHLEPGVTREVLSAARRGHRLVVIDLPRALDPVTLELAARCDLVVLVVRADLTGVAAAVRVIARLPDRDRLGAVLRGTSAQTVEVGSTLGIPVLASMPDQRGLSEALDLGLGPLRSRRGPLARAAREVLARGRLERFAA